MVGVCCRFSQVVMAFSRIALGKFLGEGAGNGIIPGQAHLVAWKKMHMQVLVFTMSGGG